MILISRLSPLPPINAANSPDNGDYLGGPATADSVRSIRHDAEY